MWLWVVGEAGVLPQPRTPPTLWAQTPPPSERAHGSDCQTRDADLTQGRPGWGRARPSPHAPLLEAPPSGKRAVRAVPHARAPPAPRPARAWDRPRASEAPRQAAVGARRAAPQSPGPPRAAVQGSPTLATGLRPPAARRTLQALSAAAPPGPCPGPPGRLPCGSRPSPLAAPLRLPCRDSVPAGRARGAQLAARPGCRKCQRTDPTAEPWEGAAAEGGGIRERRERGGGRDPGEEGAGRKARGRSREEEGGGRRGP